MTPLAFVGGWALRSALVVVATAALLGILRVRSASVRLAAWTAALFASLLIPALSPIVPAVGVPGMAWIGALQPGSSVDVPARIVAMDPLPEGTPHASAPRDDRSPRSSHPGGGSSLALGDSGRFMSSSISAAPIAEDAPGTRRAGIWQETPRSSAWPVLMLSIYGLGAGLLLARIVTGASLSRRILRRSVATGLTADGLRVLESRALSVPAALGLRRAAVVLPTGWREWPSAKLNAVLAHETSHVRRHDPVVQLISATHRALLWFSPASWWMHSRVVRLAEEASDDAALAASRDRASYAEVLLQFMQRGRTLSHWEGVAMARYGSAQGRIDRILDGTSTSRVVTRFGLAVIATIAAPVVFLAAAVAPMAPEPPQSPPPPRSAPQPPAPQPPAPQPPPPPASRPPAPAERLSLAPDSPPAPAPSAGEPVTPPPPPSRPFARTQGQGEDTPPPPPPAQEEPLPPPPPPDSPSARALQPDAPLAPLPPVGAPLPPSPPGRAAGRRPAAPSLPTLPPLAGLTAGAMSMPPTEAIAPATPSAEPAEPALPSAHDRRYLIVDGDSMSGSWDSRDEGRMRAWRAKYGPQFAWFRNEGRDYIVTDERTLGEIREAMAPQEEVNARQSEVNSAQAEVNRNQERVNSHQGEVNRAQARVNERQREVSRHYKDGRAASDAQSRVNEMQSEVNARQSVVNEAQSKVNDQQHAVSAQQEVVNRIQEGVSKEIAAALGRIFEEVVRSGRAQEAD